jgi:type III secretory pathway component EscT
MDPATLSKIVYYVNQGGSGLLVLLLYGAYKAYQIMQTLLSEIQGTNTLLKELIEKTPKP